MSADNNSTRNASHDQSNREPKEPPRKPDSRNGQALLSIGEVSERYGLSISAIRRYVNSGKLKAYVLPSLHRRFKETDVLSFLGIEQPESSSKVLIYSRVSSNKQSVGFSAGSNENSLGRQIDRLIKTAEEHGGSPVVYSDTGSGMAFASRKGFTRMLDDILAHKFDGCTLLVTHKDRLARFGAEIVEQICRSHNVHLIYTEKDSATDSQELSDDLIAIITHFSARTYGARSAKANTKQLAPDTIRRAKELYDNSTPLWHIVEILKDEGHRDSKGTFPSYHVLKRNIVDNELLELAIPNRRGKNSFEQFHGEFIKPADEKARVTKKDLYARYLEFCKEHKLIALSGRKVGVLLRQTYKYETKFTRRGTVCFVGVRLAE